jgi:glyoxylase-like metal-dependent hydrolase (beta-lactamase superfamily II)
MGDKHYQPAFATRPASRRRFLQLTLGAAAASTSLFGGTAAQTASRLRTAALRDGLTLVTGGGGNVVALKTGSGSAVVDSGSPEHANEIAALLRSQLGELRLEALFNTHWHPDHTGGNDLLAPTAGKIVAHENTRLWMSTEYYVDWEDKTYEPRAAAALPNTTFYASDPQPIALDVGDERIEYGYLREAHTDGDIYVYFRERNVLVTGGAVTAGAFPVLDHATGGWIGGIVDANRKLLEITNANTLIVPSEGPAQPRAHLEAQLEMLVAVRQRVENLMRKGRSIAEMLDADVTAGYDNWGSNRERFIANMYHGLWWAGRLDGSL